MVTLLLLLRWLHCYYCCDGYIVIIVTNGYIVIIVVNGYIVIIVVNVTLLLLL